jgi:excisionase family DNA binding protein
VIWSNTVPRATVTHTAPEFESLRSAAKRTGFSHHTFRDKIAAGELVAYRLSDKPGSAIRVKVADVDALMKSMIPEVYADRRRIPRAAQDASKTKPKTSTGPPT